MRWWGAGLWLLSNTLCARTAVTAGAGADYQPAVLRDGNTLIVAFERLDASAIGDLWLTRSGDEGATWSTPVMIVGSSANERHPALARVGNGFALFYLKGTGSTYRLFRATSVDGVSFTEAGQLDLGWSTSGEINPHVIALPNGDLVMSYQRLGGTSYVARSTDQGATWDQARTAIVGGSSQLPRIAYRASDARFLATYQTGSSNLTLWAKTTTSLSDWSGATVAISDGGDNHDSLPFVTADDVFGVFYIHANGAQYDIYSKRSADGVSFDAARPQRIDAMADDVEPHALIDPTTGAVDLYWGREAPLQSFDYDIYRQRVTLADEAVFGDAFE